VELLADGEVIGVDNNSQAIAMQEKTFWFTDKESNSNS
jgi:hypothetical protein